MVAFRDQSGLFHRVRVRDSLDLLAQEILELTTDDSHCGGRRDDPRIGTMRRGLLARSQTSRFRNQAFPDPTSVPH